MIKSVPRLPGYFVSDKGEVFRSSNGELLACKSVQTSPCGHRSVSVSSGVKKKRYQIHRLVLEAFVGECPDGMQCRHLNDVAWDNRLENLKWGTPKENGEDRVRNGKSIWGERHHKSRFSSENVVEMRKLWNEGKTVDDIRDIFGGSRASIYFACCGKTWKNLESKDSLPFKKFEALYKREIVAFDESKPLDEWLSDDRCSIKDLKLIHKRLKKGWCPERAMTQPLESLIEIFGESKTLKEWSKDPRCKATYNAITRRMRHGADAITAITSDWYVKPTTKKKKPPNLTKGQIAQILSMISDGRRYSDIGKEFGVTKSAIGKIKERMSM